MVYSRVFVFESRDYTKVPEQYISAIEAEHADKGLIVVRLGDNMKAKEREALIKYIGLLNKKVRNYQTWMDMERGRGSTVEPPQAMLQAKKWIEQITIKLNIEGPIVEEKSFLDNEDLKLEAQKMFSGEIDTSFTPKRRPGRPTKQDFTEVELDLG